MRFLLTALAVCLVSASTVAFAEQAAKQAAGPDTRCNIILMLADDQAWNGLSIAMHPELSWSRSTVIDTPRLAQLAREGMRFSAAYAPASVCAPTRASLQTGISPAALHWTKAAGPASGHRMIEPRTVRSLDSQLVTIAELLGRAGYSTAHFGKWHIDGGGPEKHGYDVSDGNNGNEYAHQFADPNPVDIFGMADRAGDFMEHCQQQQQPFFMQLSWHALHAPQNANKATLAKYATRLNAGQDEKRVGTAALAENLDSGVGRVLDRLESLGLSDRTYVIYMSDNGAGGGGGGKPSGKNKQSARTRLAGGKGSVWEGGIRSPFIIRGPGIPAGSWCHTPVVGYDLFPTFCEWAGIANEDLPSNLEGGSLTQLLRDGHGNVQRARPELVFHFPHYQSGDGPHSAIRFGRYKLLKFYEQERLALFDVESDITEQHDLATEMPKVAQDLHQRLIEYLREVDAQMAVPNPNYDPAVEPSTRQRRQDRGEQRAGKPRKPNRPRKSPGSSL